MSSSVAAVTPEEPGKSQPSATIGGMVIRPSFWPSLIFWQYG